MQIQPQDGSAHHIPQTNINTGHLNPTKDSSDYRKMQKWLKMRTNKRFRLKLFGEQAAQGKVHPCGKVSTF